jgi:hypothetical protein
VLRGCFILGVTLVPLASAQTYTYEVRHRHWRGGTMGTLRISPDSLSFDEHGKKREADSRRWTYEEIQQLTVGASEIRVLTYEDSKWQLGRDREYLFDRIPSSLAVEVYPLLTRTLDQRFIAAIADRQPAAEWKIGAKLTGNTKGTMGTLAVSSDLIVFDTKQPNEARSWRISDIQNVSSSGPFDLTITTGEKTGVFRGGDRQFHFQLQQAISDDRYSALWRKINRSKGLTFLEP